MVKIKTSFRISVFKRSQLCFINISGNYCNYYLKIRKNVLNLFKSQLNKKLSYHSRYN